MPEFLIVSTLERGIKSTFFIVFVLLSRRVLNIKSIKWASIILWSILFIYLLFPYSISIRIEKIEQCVVLRYALEPFVFVSKYIKMLVQEVGYILSNFNQLIVTSILLMYTIIQVKKRNKALKNSVRIDPDSRIEELVNSFRLKRQVQIYINDGIKVPITYGVLRPKIIIQSQVLENDNLLKYIIIHEMIHIKKFDIVFTHIKNLIACLYWYNPFVLLASSYMENDLELLCDKLVIQSVGDTVEHRKEYCLSMLQLIELKEIQEKSVLKLHPTKERMIIMKRWKRGFSGIVTLILVVILSITVSVDIKVHGKEQVISNITPFQKEIVKGDKVREITDSEYNKLTLGEVSANSLKSSDINSKVTLKGLTNKSYKFNTESWIPQNHNGFTLKLSEMSSEGGVDYCIIIKEDDTVIYKKYFTKAAILTVKADKNSRYEFIVNNQSTNTLSYRVKINSCIRKY